MLPHGCELDHIVVTAPTLRAGVEWVRERLGATAELGGAHVGMGTHNCLLKLGDAVYLEVLAPDPNAPQPARPRWFSLDRLAQDAPPRLTAWVASTGDLRAAVRASPERLGNVEPMRRGALDWLITIPEDGSLPLGGAAPILIEWLAPPHPASRLRESGCMLVRLEIASAEAGRVERLLDAIGFTGEVQIRPVEAGARPLLLAHVRTASGIVRLGDS